jgi:hypothetical protein
MKKLFNIILMAAAVASASSCVFVRVNPNDFNGVKSSEFVIGSNNSETNTFTVPQFTGIDSSVPADIDYYMTDGEPTIKVTAPDNILAKLKFDVENGILKVYFEDGNQRINVGSSGIKVIASSSTLESLSIRGAGDFDADYLKCSGFNVEVSGAGDITLGSVICGDLSIAVRGAGDIDVAGLECRTVKVDVAGAGDVVLAGKADSANLSIRGAGDIDARRLDCPDIVSNVSGMGSIRRK